MGKFSLISLLLFFCISCVKGEAAFNTAENSRNVGYTKITVMLSATPRNTSPLLAAEPIQTARPATSTARQGYSFTAVGNKPSIGFNPATALTSSFYQPARWPLLTGPGYFFIFHQFW